MRALVWLRRDLRIQDATALAAASQQADEVIVAFIFDRKILDELKDVDDRRLTFIHRSLQEVDAKLREHGSQLIVRHGDPVEEIPRLAHQLSVHRVYAGRDYEPYARRRDERVGKELSGIGIKWMTVKDHVILEPDQMLNDAGQPFKVYTPFGKAWRARLQLERDAATHVPDLQRLVKRKGLAEFEEAWGLRRLGIEEAELWIEPGEDAAHRQLDSFLRRIDDYAELRDIPAEQGTSALSVHFRFGTISMRGAVRSALGSDSHGADKWLSELIWREFYQAILWHFPHVVTEPFQAQYKNLDYPGTREHFDTWCEGRTGYPIVDAAMRAFNATGYMHNRLRMVVASFLTKDLLCDYRWGEEYFARYLLDFELASNNGGWQWAASVGVDPQPYFRIFNPILQSKKFDRDGEFIKQWIPELKEVAAEAIHAPWEASEFDLASWGADGYPRPIVDHATQRDLAIKLLESARSRS